MTSTKVIFRKDKKDNTIIAFFPELTAKYGHIACYDLMGEHGEATLEYYRKNTTKATEEEYQKLLNTLRVIGYNDLVIKQRMTTCDLVSMNMNRYL